jgi:hypothetical protein
MVLQSGNPYGVTKWQPLGLRVSDPLQNKLFQKNTSETSSKHQNSILNPYGVTAGNPCGVTKKATLTLLQSGSPCGVAKRQPLLC